MTEKHFRELLERAARTIIEDIRGDMGDILGPGTDYGYECYVDSIPASFVPQYGLGYVGTVYAGDLGTWFFISDGPEDLELISPNRKEAQRLLPRVYGRGGIYAYEYEGGF